MKEGRHHGLQCIPVWMSFKCTTTAPLTSREGNFTAFYSSREAGLTIFSSASGSLASSFNSFSPKEPKEEGKGSREEKLEEAPLEEIESYCTSKEV